MRHQRTQEAYQGRPEIDRRLDTEGTRRNGFTPAPKKNLTTEMMTKTGKAEVQPTNCLLVDNTFYTKTLPNIVGQLL